MFRRLSVLLVIGFLFAFLFAASVPAQGITSHPNIFGGYNYYQGGHFVGSSQPNIRGGSDYWNNGHYGGSTQPNIFGGQTYTPPAGRSGGWASQPNVFGGQNYSNGLQSRPNVFGGRTYNNGVQTRPNVYGGYSSLEDQLRNANYSSTVPATGQ